MCIAVQVVMPVTAQVGDEVVAAAYNTGYGPYVIMTNGDVYHTRQETELPWYMIGNVFSGGTPITNTDSSLGDVKRAFR